MSRCCMLFAIRPCHIQLSKRSWRKWISSSTNFLKFPFCSPELKDLVEQLSTIYVESSSLNAVKTREGCSKSWKAAGKTRGKLKSFARKALLEKLRESCSGKTRESSSNSMASWTNAFFPLGTALMALAASMRRPRPMRGGSTRWKSACKSTTKHRPVFNRNYEHNRLETKSKFTPLKYNVNSLEI